MEYNELKNAIKEVIKENGEGGITGKLLQDSLLSLINNLGAGYQYRGLYQGDLDRLFYTKPDEKVFYFYLASVPEAGDTFDLPDAGLYIVTFDTEWIATHLVDIFEEPELSFNSYPGGIQQISRNTFDKLFGCVRIRFAGDYYPRESVFGFASYQLSQWSGSILRQIFRIAGKEPSYVSFEGVFARAGVVVEEENHYVDYLDSVVVVRAQFEPDYEERYYLIELTM